MDDPSLDAHEHRRALAGLTRIHRVSATAAAMWPELLTRGRAARREGRSMRVLDVACGGGDVTVALRRRAIAADVPIRVDGCDLSGVALDRARERTQRAGLDCDYFAADALTAALPAGYDAMVCSLFLHHLTDEQAAELLRRMAEASELVLVSDLVRSSGAWTATWLGTRLLTRSAVVHVDGPRSVEGAFTVREMGLLCERAGLSGARIERVWPMRMLVTHPGAKRGGA